MLQIGEIKLLRFISKYVKYINEGCFRTFFFLNIYSPSSACINKTFLYMWSACELSHVYTSISQIARTTFGNHKKKEFLLRALDSTAHS